MTPAFKSHGDYKLDIRPDDMKKPYFKNLVKRQKHERCD